MEFAVQTQMALSVFLLYVLLVASHTHQELLVIVPYLHKQIDQIVFDVQLYNQNIPNYCLTQEISIVKIKIFLLFYIIRLIEECKD